MEMKQHPFLFAGPHVLQFNRNISEQSMHVPAADELA